MQETTVRLPDGHRIGYAEYGAPHGRPVFFFHGIPGARRQVFPGMAAAAAAHGVRLVAPERPGYGLSDPQPGRSLLDWARDTAAVADALGIEAFHIASFSGGGLYALACARALPERVRGVALAGGLAPLDAPGVMQGMPPLVSGLYALARAGHGDLRDALSPLASSASALLAAMTGTMPPCDKQVADCHADDFIADFSEALRSGIEGAVTDFVLAARPWGFELSDIPVKAQLWHGSLDANAPPAMAEHLAAALPNARLTLLPGEGHLACFTHWEEILARLAG